MNAQIVKALTDPATGIWPRSTLGAALVGMTPTFGLATAWIIWWAL